MTALLFSALTAEFLLPGPCSRREASWNGVFPGERPATGCRSLQVSRVKFWERAAELSEWQCWHMQQAQSWRRTATLQKQDLGPEKTTSWYLELRTNRRSAARTAHYARNNSGALLKDEFMFSLTLTLTTKCTQPLFQTFSLSIVSLMSDLKQRY